MFPVRRIVVILPNFVRAQKPVVKRRVTARLNVPKTYKISHPTYRHGLRLTGIKVVKTIDMKTLRENGLSIVLFGLFAFSVAGQYVSGWYEYNEEQRQHGQPEVTATGYLGEGHFWEAIFENWESEFLQMAAYILLTVFLFQKGASDSKRLGAVERVDRTLPKKYQDPDAPWPVRKGGIVLALYENSLSLALIFLFVASFVAHGISGAAKHNQEQAEHGGEQLSTLQFMESSSFWFESFQNWQSEFLSIGVLIVLSIFLRQKGSPESKPVDAPYAETGR